MRRKDREITDERIIRGILETAGICRIAMVDEGVPYVVPLNYGYSNNALYVHSAPSGRKIDILKRNDTVCFEIESDSTIIMHAEPCRWGTRSRSLIGYGRVEIIIDYQEKKRGLDVLMEHHGKRGRNVYDEKQLSELVILRIRIDSVTCKQLGNWD